MMIAALIIGGLILLFFGGESLVNGAVAIARKMNISPLLIGLVLVGFGTSTPELITSVIAALEEKPGIALGNVIGSNVANIFLILGATALIIPLSCDKGAFKKDGSFMLLATVVMLGFVLLGEFSRASGFVFLAMLFAYIGYSIWIEKRGETGTSETHIPETTPEEKGVSEVTVLEFKDTYTFAFGQFVIGLILTFLGAKFLVSGSVTLATNFGISDTIIGLTIVAIGTSLPELVASLMAALKKQGDLAYGNIIGSNIYNILGIIGVTATIHPFSVPIEIAHFDIWVMVAAMIALMIASASSWKIVRWEGAAFLLAYFAYMAFLASQAIA
tara:strand:+ start:93322 stop:94311 length:990 start_codon:yes stop_codon:yes gene_type:complete